MRVSEACRAGREQECKKVQIVESWKLMGAIAGSSAGPVVVGKHVLPLVSLPMACWFVP